MDQQWETILQQFGTELPEDDESTVDTRNPSAQISTVNHSKQKIPYYLTEIDEKRWVRPATKHISKQENKQSPVLSRPSALIERPLLIKNEASVVASARLYLIHSINLLLGELYGNKIECTPEMAFQRSIIDSQTNMVTVRHMRMDLNWRAKVNGKAVIVAIMEFKKRRYINEEDFDTAVLTPEEVRDFRREWKRSAPARKLTIQSKITGNLGKFTKQVAAYAEAEACPYVVLFDWNNLVLMQFDKDGAIGISARTTIVKPDNFRKALLGFLLVACEEAGLKAKK
jgi:hypothetical protein